MGVGKSPGISRTAAAPKESKQPRPPQTTKLHDTVEQFKRKRADEPDPQPAKRSRPQVQPDKTPARAAPVKNEDVAHVKKKDVAHVKQEDGDHRTHVTSSQITSAGASQTKTSTAVHVSNIAGAGTTCSVPPASERRAKDSDSSTSPRPMDLDAGHPPVFSAMQASGQTTVDGLSKFDGDAPALNAESQAQHTIEMLGVKIKDLQNENSAFIARETALKKENDDQHGLAAKRLKTLLATKKAFVQQRERINSMEITMKKSKSARAQSTREKNKAVADAAKVAAELHGLQLTLTKTEKALEAQTEIVNAAQTQFTEQITQRDAEWQAVLDERVTYWEDQVFASNEARQHAETELEARIRPAEREIKRLMGVCAHRLVRSQKLEAENEDVERKWRISACALTAKDAANKRDQVRLRQEEQRLKAWAESLREHEKACPADGASVVKATDSTDKVLIEDAAPLHQVQTEASHTSSQDACAHEDQSANVVEGAIAGNGQA